MVCNSVLIFDYNNPNPSPSVILQPHHMVALATLLVSSFFPIHVLLTFFAFSCCRKTLSTEISNWETWSSTQGTCIRMITKTLSPVLFAATGEEVEDS